MTRPRHEAAGTLLAAERRPALIPSARSTGRIRTRPPSAQASSAQAPAAGPRGDATVTACGRVTATVTDKPILASWLCGAATPASLATLRRAGISTFACPDVAVRTFGYLGRHGQNLRGLGEPTGPARSGTNAVYTA